MVRHLTPPFRAPSLLLRAQPVQGNTAPDDRRDKHDNPPLQERSKPEPYRPATTRLPSDSRNPRSCHVIAIRAKRTGHTQSAGDPHLGWFLTKPGPLFDQTWRARGDRHTKTETRRSWNGKGSTLLHYRTAVALQKEKLRQAAGPADWSRGVDDSRHGTPQLIVAPLNHLLINTVAGLRNMSRGLIRGTSWSKTR